MDLTIQNPWWRNWREIENDEKVAEALNKKISVVYELIDKKNKIILGPRQVGKTSMLKLLVYDLITKREVKSTDICYFSCEPLSSKNDIIEVVREFDKLSMDSEHKYVFLDEVTQIPDWELAIKLILETKLSQDKTVISTGSNALLLKKGSERLPGRNISTELFLPLSFREFLLKFGSEELKLKLKQASSLSEIGKAAVNLSIFSEEIESKFYFYLKTGGYLKAIYEMFEKRKISEETYETYIKWILGDLSRLDRKEYIFKSALIGILKNYGTKFSLHSIAKETDIKSHVTVAEYLDTLQSLLLTNQLYQIDYSKRMPAFRKERKNYFVDPLLYSACSGYVRGRYQDYSEENKSSIVEGVVCEALSRSVRKNLDTSSQLWFYIKKKETDFVLKQENELVGIEVKWQERVSKSDFNNFHMFNKGILVSKKELSFDGGLLVIPAHLFLSVF